MPLVLAERDYKRLTLFTKIAGIFLFASGTIMMLDHQKVLLGLLLLVLGTFVTLAPVPMTVVQPDSYANAVDDELSVNE